MNIPNFKLTGQFDKHIHGILVRQSFESDMFHYRLFKRKSKGLLFLGLLRYLSEMVSSDCSTSSQFSPCHHLFWDLALIYIITYLKKKKS